MRYAGPEVARRIEGLQAAADSEGEAQRGYIQDYAAELDRQTRLFYRRRDDVILGGAKKAASMQAMCEEIAGARGGETRRSISGGRTPTATTAKDTRRWRRSCGRDYDVDCSPLYGLDLALLPGGLAALLNDRLERQASRLRWDGGGGNPSDSPTLGRADDRENSCSSSWDGAFPEAARLLYLQVCGDLWPGPHRASAGFRRQPVARRSQP